MPQTRDELRAKFMNFETRDDGIRKAEAVVTAAGGNINRGNIDLTGVTLTKEAQDAVDFLCEEWDYAVFAWAR